MDIKTHLYTVCTMFGVFLLVVALIRFFKFLIEKGVFDWFFFGLIWAMVYLLIYELIKGWPKL